MAFLDENGLSTVVNNIKTKFQNTATSAQGAKADSAVQTIKVGTNTQTKEDGVVTLPSYPEKLSDLEDDSTHRTVTDDQITTWNDGHDAIQDVKVNGTSVVTDRIALISMPTKLSELTDDETHRTVTDTQITTWNDGRGGYKKPDDGIPSSDMTAAVQASLSLADSSVQDVKVNNTSVVSSGVASVTVPTKVSELTNDSKYITESYHDSTKQDLLSVNPSTTTDTLTGLTINNVAYEIGGGAIQDVTVNGASVVSDKVAAVTVPTSLGELTSSDDYMTVTKKEKSTWNNSTGGYKKPDTGIPSSDMTAAVQASLALADSALQEETYKGTLTGVSMNGSEVTVTDGVAVLGAVVTDVSGKADKAVTLAGYGITDAINVSEKGAANGVATLGTDGRLTSSQLPSTVDEILWYETIDLFPETGEASKIYVDRETNLTYRWGGSTEVGYRGYVEISPSIALGETSSTAYAGDKGKANADAISTHTSDSTIHITEAERTQWNSITTATTSTVGLVRPDGTTITIDSNGIISGSSSGDVPNGIVYTSYTGEATETSYADNLKVKTNDEAKTELVFYPKTLMEYVTNDDGKTIEEIIPAVTDTYSSTSTDAMSGIAVASAVSSYLPISGAIASDTDLGTLAPGMYSINGVVNASFPVGDAMYGSMIQGTGDYKPQLLMAGMSGDKAGSYTRRYLKESSKWSDWTSITITALADLTDDSLHRTVTDAEKASWVTKNMLSFDSSTGTLTITTT